jgi:NitT/TauT family transport system substrate-binding protein
MLATVLSLAAGPAPASGAETLKVGTTSAVSDAGVFIAQEKGYFQEQGLDVEIIRFSSAMPMMTALATGQIDVLRGAQSAGLFNGAARGIQFKLVADGGNLAKGGGYLAIVLRKDLAEGATIKSAADLKGLRVAVASPSGTSTIVLDRLLKTAGLGLKDVDLKYISIPDQIAAFANKGIDAAVMLEPSISATTAQGLAVRWKGGDDIYPDMQAGVLGYSEVFARRTNPARKFMVAYVHALRDYYAAFFEGRGREEIASILAKYTNIKDLKAYERMVPVGMNPDGRLNVHGLKADQDWYATVDRSVPEKVDVDTLVDQSFVDFAVQKLGPYARRVSGHGTK